VAVFVSFLWPWQWISQYYCSFDQINATLVNIRDFYQTLCCSLSRCPEWTSPQKIDRKWSSTNKWIHSPCSEQI